MRKQSPLWRERPVGKDFDAARSFLHLVYPAAIASKLLLVLRRVKAVRHPAKDLLRASGLPLLPREEPHVEADLKRISKGKPLSPVLVIQGDMRRRVPLVVADGYHRICAICYYDETASISCLMARG